jgi:hypothetical protein
MERSFYGFRGPAYFRVGAGAAPAGVTIFRSRVLLRDSRPPPLVV